MKTATIVGSMKFAEEMKRTAFELESRRGVNVLQCTYNEEGAAISEEMRKRLEEAHFQKIKMSDMVYVVDVGGYIGDSAKKEIEYAAKLGKEILFFSRDRDRRRKA